MTKANPPMTKQDAGKFGGMSKHVLQGNVLEVKQIRQIRMAHDNISDTEYSEIKSEAADNEEPLKRSKLQEIR